ncbi:MAG: hypothetical protein J6P66_07495 [Bacteroidaceae bacterium]|nr:hypothetical protein [Bacteroidaceae bacterium]
MREEKALLSFPSDDEEKPRRGLTEEGVREEKALLSFPSDDKEKPRRGLTEEGVRATMKKRLVSLPAFSVLFQ